MNIVDVSLNENFKKHFGISEVVNTFEGWQKKVFVIKIWAEIQVLKLFKDYWARENRELWIYSNYSHIYGLPKIIKIEEYNWDKIVFEKYIDWKVLWVIKDNYLNNHQLISKLIYNIVDILTPLWEQNIIHRDLKPSNIIIDGTTWHPHVIDFWIARDLDAESLTDTWFQPKTVLFSSPEQILGKKDLISYRSDFFNLWIIAYYLYYWLLPFWNRYENIISAFQKWDLIYDSRQTCEFNIFFAQVFSLNPSRRPRNPELLLQLLPN